MKIKEKFELIRDKKSDINEHMETFAKYASECNHITEFGVREVCSTYGFLYGMPKGAKMVSYDIDYNQYIRECHILTYTCGKDWTFNVGDTREIVIEPTDLLFIDTLHNYDLLKEELHRHGNKSRKYIMFHDTVTYGEKGETAGHEGLLRAIKEFQKKYPEWQTKEVFTNNNGLTILERIVTPKTKKNYKVTVLTAIYGDIDMLKLQPDQSININWVCYTDNPNLKCEEGADRQREIKLDTSHKHLHPRMQAKYIRTHPYDYVDAETVVWMDGSGRLTKSDSIEHFVTQYLDKTDMLCFQHPERNNIVDEAQFCINGGNPYTITKYKGLPLKQQAQWYMDKGFPKSFGLSATGMLITKKNNKKVRNFLHSRWTECLEWTYQDQLSFDYIIWKLGIKRQWLQEDEWHNDYITYMEKHRHDK